ncbi:hypothetical protein [Nocardioides baculatus]|uniref:DUF3592 domain-containing protein n=1 Tax=Nocardioides baculatus TaxID=2801337 RepID=A0ABS1L3F4_9ACTN|nr:hypothetical protein [Nocardioides baculatus]MBL0746231.1 hypothetical protein [Nocardioides baculatus]
MGETTTLSVPAPPAYDEWRDGRWRLTGAVFALAWLIVLVTILAVGERRADLGSLHGVLADGSVSEVEVTGLPKGGLGRGYSTVRLEWEARFIHRYTEILVVSSDRLGRRVSNPDHLPVVVGDPVVTLQELRPDVAIVRHDYRSGSWFEAAGWTLRGAPGSALLVLWFAALFMVMGAPEPWRATRWAWFWLALASPLIGAIAYVLVGGPLGVGRPRHPGRRLTGGWAFLLAAVIFGGTSGA